MVFCLKNVFVLSNNFVSLHKICIHIFHETIDCGNREKEVYVQYDQ